MLPCTLFQRLDDPRVRAIVERWVHYIAVGIFNTVATVDPEVVLQEPPAHWRSEVDMAGTAQHHVLSFEINTNFTRYALFAYGRIGIPGTFATPNSDVDAFYEALVQVVRKQRAPLDGVAISAPGFIDTKTQTARTAGALKFLAKQQFGVEPVVRLGGSTSRAPWRRPTREDAPASTRDWKTFTTAITRCRHSGNAGLIGAYYAFMEEVGVNA